MTKVDFYILPSADPSARLDFACKLTEKAWRMGHRIYLHCSDAAQRDDLDARLWAFKGESFVPHGPAENEPEGLIVLGLGDDCGQHQDLLVNLDLKVPVFAKQFARVAEVVVEDPTMRGRVSVSTANRAILCKITVYSDSEHSDGHSKTAAKFRASAG